MNYVDPDAKECGFMGCGRAQCENRCNPTKEDSMCEPSFPDFTGYRKLEIRNWRCEYGDGVIAHRNEILRSVVGSGVHGIAIEGTDDHDEMGIYIEPPEHLLGVGSQDERGVFTEPRRDYMARTAEEGERSYHGDVDLTIYSLGKYLRLALKGNPTALIPLYAPPESILVNTRFGFELRENREWFLSQRAVHRFLGYMQAQHERMMGGGKRNRVPKRSELIDAYGWDVKYGSHALRLAYQGLEVATDGHLTLPLKEDVRSRVLDVKNGNVSRDEVSEEITFISNRIQKLLDTGDTPLPKEPNMALIEAWALHARREFWGWITPGEGSFLGMDAIWYRRYLEGSFAGW